MSDSAENSKNPDQNFYSWQSWFSILSGQATDYERRQYKLARDAANEESDCKRCEKQRDWLLKYSKYLPHPLLGPGPNGIQVLRSASFATTYSP